MSERFSDELISAYLDGELSGDEQAQVEELLMDSVAHRKMFNELRALRDSLQSLPHYTLADDFSERVLRRAERVMLSQSSMDSAVESPAAEDAPIELGVRGDAHVESNRARRAVLASLAVAAVLLVALFVVLPKFGGENKKDGGGQNVAGMAAEQEGRARNQQSSDSNRKSQTKLGVIDSPDSSESAGAPGQLHDSPLSKSYTPMLDDDRVLQQENNLIAPAEIVAEKHNYAGDVADKVAPADAGPVAGAVAGPPADPIAAVGVGERYEQARDARPLTNSIGDLDPANEAVFVIVEVPEYAYRQRSVNLTLAQNGILEQSAVSEDLLKRKDGDAERLAMSAMRRKLGKELEIGELRDSETSGTYDVLVVDATPDRIDEICNSIRRQGFAISVNATNSLAETSPSPPPASTDGTRARGGVAANSIPNFEAQSTNQLSLGGSDADEENGGVKNARNLNRNSGQAFGGFNASEPADQPALTPARRGPDTAQAAPSSPRTAELKADSAVESLNSKTRAEPSGDKSSEDVQNDAKMESGSTAPRKDVSRPAGYFTRVPAMNDPSKREEQDRARGGNSEGGKAATEKKADEPPRPDSFAQPSAQIESASAGTVESFGETEKLVEPQTVRVIFIVRAAKQLASPTASDAEAKPAAMPQPQK